MGWRRATLLMVFGLVGLLLQGTVLRSLLPAMLVPNIMSVLVVFTAIYESTIMGSFLAFGLGLLLDMESGLLVGPFAGASVAVFGTLASLSQRIFVESPLALAVVVFFAALLSDFVYAVMVFEFKPFTGHMALSSLTQGLVTAIVSVPVFALCKHLLLRREPLGGGMRKSRF